MRQVKHVRLCVRHHHLHGLDSSNQVNNKHPHFSNIFLMSCLCFEPRRNTGLFTRTFSIFLSHLYVWDPTSMSGGLELDLVKAVNSSIIKHKKSDNNTNYQGIPARSVVTNLSTWGRNGIRLSFSYVCEWRSINLARFECQGDVISTIFKFFILFSHKNLTINHA